MYDSREKAALDLQSSLIDAREEGLELGIEKGIELGVEKGIGKGLEVGQIELIQTLQEILGEPVSEVKALEGHALEQLQAQATELRNRIIRRS